MQASAIRHLAISDHSGIVAAALFEETVQIWSWKTGNQIGEFKTVLDFGVRKLALTPDGTVCIAGSWGRRKKGKRGLAAYSIPDGTLLWLREDIPHIGSIRLSGSGMEIYCGVEGSSAQVVETATGKTMRRIRAVTEVIGSPYTRHQLMVQKRPEVVRTCRDGQCFISNSFSYPDYLMCGPSEFRIPPLSFGLLDATFAPESVCLSEPRDALHPRENIGGIRLIDLATGHSQWHLDIGSNQLTFNSSDKRFYCVSAPYNDPSESSLIRLSSTILDCDRVALLGSCCEAAFSGSGTILVTVQGDVFETSTGDLLMHLEFPDR
jgi:hypothetical protein